MSSFLNTDISYLSGVGPSRAELLKKELGIFTFGDLLNHFPFRYVDRSIIHNISEVHDQMPYIQLKGQLKSLQEVGIGKNARLSGVFQDQSGSIELVWFKGAKWIKKSLKLNTDYILFGKPTSFKNKLNIAHPELEDPKLHIGKGHFQPVYALTEKVKHQRINSKVLNKLMLNLIVHESFRIEEFFPYTILNDAALCDRELAYKWIHFPKNYQELEQAQHRLKFEELFVLQLSIARIRNKVRKLPGISFPKVGEFFNRFFEEQLSFELTDAQKRVMKEIRADLKSGIQMNRLLQGDVGSGKSIVALLSMLIAIDNGYQASLMAPTEILATQHYEGFKDQLQSIGIQSALLTGSTPKSERKIMFEGLQSGTIGILFGTHALIEDPVRFKAQGLVIIDEQHRFGVAQRAKLWQKDKHNPHVLVMTATPIPRTLAMTVYGDLDVSKIDQMPMGRKPIKTAHRTEADRLRVWGFVKEQIKLGRQVYMVYPLIEESATLDLKNLNEGFDQLLHYLPRPEFQIDMLHGRMKARDKELIMERFKNGETQVLVSTTVIEVGINVPNATVMIIENSERFGLAQLHQLRGRVGRGAEQSYCILVTGPKLSRDGKERIAAMVKTTDGFEIAELDLQLRGPGDIEGTQQSGIAQLKLASITKDEHLMYQARELAIKTLEEDSDLSKPIHGPLRFHLAKMKNFRDWSRVS